MLSLILILACTAPAPEAPASEPVPAPVEEPAAPSEPGFESEVTELPDALKQQMIGTSWREGCPTPLEELRLLVVSHRDFEGGVQQGRLVLHHEAVEPVRSALEAAFEAGFPIRRMEPVSAFGGSDDASMAADNTSAFNCRPIKGTKRWSEHSTGKALDLNPRENPWVSKGRVDPPEGERFADRSLGEPGMLVAGDPVVTAFREAGWGWGGSWSSLKDYQHFSASGR